MEYILKEDIFKEVEEHFNCNHFTLSSKTYLYERYIDNCAAH